MDPVLRRLANNEEHHLRLGLQGPVPLRQANDIGTRLKRNSSVRKVTMDLRHILPDSLHILARAIAHNPNVSKVFLRHGIDSPYMNALGTLCRSPQITDLSLAVDRMPREAMRTFMDHLRGSSITHCEVSYVNARAIPVLDATTTALLHAILEQNHRRRLPTPRPPGWVPASPGHPPLPLPSATRGPTRHYPSPPSAPAPVHTHKFYSPPEFLTSPVQVAYECLSRDVDCVVDTVSSMSTTLTKLGDTLHNMKCYLKVLNPQ